MSAQPFYRPDAVTPDVNTIPGEDSRDCYTPADTWLRRLARKASPPMPNTSFQMDAPESSIQNDVVLQGEPQPVLALVPMPEESNAQEIKFSYEENKMPAHLYSVNAVEKSQFSIVEQIVNDAVLKMQVAYLALNQYKTPTMCLHFMPDILLICKNANGMRRIAREETRDIEPSADQLKLWTA